MKTYHLVYYHFNNGNSHDEKTSLRYKQLHDLLMGCLQEEHKEKKWFPFKKIPQFTTALQTESKGLWGFRKSTLGYDIGSLSQYSLIEDSVLPELLHDLEIYRSHHQIEPNESLILLVALRNETLEKYEFIQTENNDIILNSTGFEPTKILDKITSITNLHET